MAFNKHTVLTGIKTSFLTNCEDKFISINHKNKYNTVRSLGGIMGIIFEEYSKGRLLLLTYAINNKGVAGVTKIKGSGTKYIKEKADELKGYDLKLIDEVIYNIYKFHPTTSSLEDKFDVANNTLKSIYKDKIDYLVALAMFCHMADDRNIILQNTNLLYFDEFIEHLKKDYPTDLKIIKIHKRNEQNYSKAIIIDPLALFTKKDGYILNLEGVFKENLPSSLIQ